MADFLRKLFRRKQQPPLVCAVSLDDHGHPVGDDPNHKHTAACFIDFEPLAVVELFQSQSCPSCHVAVPGILAGVNSPNLLLLTFNISLFDHTGWKDTYANGTSDQRHRAYATRWQRKTLFAPQIVVNGVADGSGAGGGSDVAEAVQQARAAQAARPWRIYLDANDTDVRIDSDAEAVGNHDILVVQYQAGDEKVKVGKGPNKGKKLDHRNRVTSVTKIGEWAGGNLTAALPALRSGENAVVVVQEGGAGGAIVAVAKV
jgi:hypothetical protein